MHNYGTVSRLLLLPLHSGNNVNHSSSLGWYPDLRPSVEVEVSDVLWLLLLVGWSAYSVIFMQLKMGGLIKFPKLWICKDSINKTGRQIYSFLNFAGFSWHIKHHALVCRWAPCLWEWRFHTAYLQSAQQHNLQMSHCPLMANTGNTFPGRKGQMEIQLGHIWLIYIRFLLLYYKCAPQKQYKTIKYIHRLTEKNKTMT